MKTKDWIYIVLFIVLFAVSGCNMWNMRSVVKLPPEMAQADTVIAVDSVTNQPQIIVERTFENTIIREQIMAPAVPDYMVFAGDTVWLDRADLRERMDRELISFTFSHSNSILMIKRANRIFPQVEPLLAEYGVPDDLKYLMAIESNVQETAVSTAGAAGLWQFMKSAGKEYGLEVSSTVDERYNLELATKAACTYLKKSYAKFGDWMTVAAAYNAGPAGISKKLSDQGQKTALNLYLVEETSRYMLRILAAKMMFEDPGAFGFKLKASDLYPYIPVSHTVTVSSNIEDLAEFARRNGVSYADLKRANYWLRDTKLTVSKGHTYEIAIPDTKALHYDPSTTVAHNPAWVTDVDSD